MSQFKKYANRKGLLWHDFVQKIIIGEANINSYERLIQHNLANFDFEVLKWILSLHFMPEGEPVYMFFL